MSNLSKEYISISPSQTKKIAKNLAKEILNNFKIKKALVIALEGELGSGKTTFLKGFVRILNIKEKEIVSPTFIILRRIPISYKKFRNFFHVDCYRIKNEKELKELNFFSILKDWENIIAIEWAEKIKRFLPKETVYLNFEILNKQQRKIVVKWKK